MHYVLPVPTRLKGEFLGLCRLYANPSEPEALDDAPLCILDNGAWGFHVRGKTWSERSLHMLHEYYLRFGGDDRPAWAGVMPDIFLDPIGTVKLVRWWRRKIGRSLGPVIQFPGKKRIEVGPAIDQIREHAEHSPGIVFVSNPGLTGREAQDARFLIVIDLCRKAFPGAWIHVLGAGWSLADIRDWRAVGVDSIDSIAYYTSRKPWARDGGTQKETSVLNGIAGCLIAAGEEVMVGSEADNE